jgi:alpha-muurolene/germacrene-A/gamma-muurolene synthase
MVVILMELHGMRVQEAVNHVADRCEVLVNRFEENRKLVPSFGEDLDPLVTIYIEGLQHWISGFLNWCFETERYFGKEAPDVQIHRVVRLSQKSSRSRSRRRA